MEASKRIGWIANGVLSRVAKQSTEKFKQSNGGIEKEPTFSIYIPHDIPDILLGLSAYPAPGISYLTTRKVSHFRLDPIEFMVPEFVPLEEDPKAIDAEICNLEDKLGLSEPLIKLKVYGGEFRTLKDILFPKLKNKGYRIMGASLGYEFIDENKTNYIWMENNGKLTHLEASLYLKAGLRSKAEDLLKYVEKMRKFDRLIKA